MTNRSPSAPDTSPSTQLMQMIWPGAMAAQAIYLAAKLGVADLIKDGSKQVSELSQLTGTDTRSLHRLLRALTSFGLFTEEAEGIFQNTPVSETLCTQQAGSMRPWAIFLGAPFLWRAWGDLHETVVTGQPAIDRVFGKPFFSYLAEHPDEAEVFNAAMTAGSEMVVTAILAAYDFSRFKRIVDVGGGQGALLGGILKANPATHGVLFDFPEVVNHAMTVKSEDLSTRCEIIGGDFFTGVPEAGDAYLLKGIIHDWNDEDALKVLRNCRRAIKPDGVLLLVETILKPSGQPDPGNFMDVLMLTLVGGRERTESDFRELLQNAGFKLTRVVSTEGPFVIEGHPF